MKLTIKNTTKDVEIEHSGPLNVQDKNVIDLLHCVSQLNAIVPLDNLELKQINPPNTDYDYAFTALDGRSWSQTLHFDTTDPGMTFDVTDRWRVSEFVFNRSVRDVVVRLVNDSQVTGIKIKFS